ncbi:2-hydroxychromene-2-carboxylate isomerase [Pigmentiphaga sp. CHJ604]|uniref:2-hydroxychromene-2-carboxylate isomerase n=1 Tax=Pigmentiphaga sp. CHJ604 TaxID=3081984 RepID=UPI0030D6097B
MAAATIVDFYFDFMSPYAYLAHARLPELAKRHGARLAYHPIDLFRIKLAVGNTGPSNRDIPLKHRYLRSDLQRWATAYGIPFVPPSGYGSTRLNCGAFRAIDEGRARYYADSVWRHVWGSGGAMDDDGLLAAVAKEMSWPEDEFLAYVRSSEAGRRLEASNAAALERGVFGVPTMIADGAMWWGNDRLDFLERHLQGRPLSTDNT